MNKYIILGVVGLLVICFLIALISTYAMLFILLAGSLAGAYLCINRYKGVLIVLGVAVSTSLIAGLGTYLVGFFVSLLSNQSPYSLDITNWIVSGSLHSPADIAGRLGLLLGVLIGLVIVVIANRKRKMHGIGIVQGFPVVEGGWADRDNIKEIVEFGPPQCPHCKEVSRDE